MQIDIDKLGDSLTYLAKLGKSLPSSWDGAEHHIPIKTGEGTLLGDLLPGMGLYTDCDLKYLGITESITDVYQRTETHKIAEVLNSERDAIRLCCIRQAALQYGNIASDAARNVITSYDGIIAARCGGNFSDVWISKTSITTVGNVFYSMMQAGMGNIAPISGLAAGSSSAGSGGSVCTKSTTGAWSLGIPNPADSNHKYLLTMGYYSTISQALAMLVDILVGVSGVSSNSATNQVNTVALTRYTSGAGVWPAMEPTTAQATGAFNWGGTYTNQGGSSASFQATAAFSGCPLYRLSASSGYSPFMPTLASGDYGVQGVTTITTSAQFTGTLNLYLVYPLLLIPSVLNYTYAERDSTIQIDGICELVNASQVIGCLGCFIVSSSTSSGNMGVFIRTCEG